MVPSREAGRPLMLVGHGLRTRTIEGPLAPGHAPELTDVITRRYACRACEAILVVVPRGVTRSYRYSLSAIAWALALWAYQRASASSVRARASTARAIGDAAPSRWASLPRWTRCALALFDFTTPEVGTTRERAARVATFVASHSPQAHGPVPIDAFFGAAFCSPS
jgi:hypothetical protein